MRTLILLFALGGTALAHHGSAEYQTDRHVTVTGTIKEWRWSNPHTWVFLTVRTASGAIEQWDGEGPPLTWAAQRGWSSATLRAGEEVSLVMYPSKRAARAGLIKQVRRANGDVLEVSRPWLDR